MRRHAAALITYVCPRLLTLPPGMPRSVWADPDYGTPLYSVDGGASQCMWEVGTAHRSMPTLKAEYIGADLLGPEENALFRVTIGNSLDYYGAGVASGKYRPGWSIANSGYLPPSFSLSVDPTTLTDGLTVAGALGGYGEFGKGKFDILLQVVRDGASSMFEFPAPEISFAQDCLNHNIGNTISVGEASAVVPLSMPNPEQTIKYLAPCPKIAWSGTILEKQLFSAIAAQDGAAKTSVPVAVVNTGDSDRKVERIGLEWRVAFAGQQRSTWHGFDTNEVRAVNI